MSILDLIPLFFALSVSVIVFIIWAGFWSLLHSFIHESSHSTVIIVLNFFISVMTTYVGSLFVLFLMLNWSVEAFGVSFQ